MGLDAMRCRGCFGESWAALSQSSYVYGQHAMTCDESHPMTTKTWLLVSEAAMDEWSRSVQWNAEESMDVELMFPCRASATWKDWKQFKTHENVPLKVFSFKSRETTRMWIHSSALTEEKLLLLLLWLLLLLSNY